MTFGWAGAVVSEAKFIDQSITSGALPHEVLTAIAGNQLSGNAIGFDQVAQGFDNLARIGALLCQRGLRFGGKLARLLMNIFQGRAGPDPIDPNVRGQGLRQCPRRGPQCGLGQSVGKKQRVQFEHAHIDHVDDEAGLILRQGAGKMLGQ